MRCQQFESRLNAVLDERRDPALDPQLRAHAHTCPPCHGLLETHRQVLSAYRQRNGIAPSQPTRSWQNRAPGERPRTRTIALAALLATACAVPLLLSNLPPTGRSEQPQAKLPDSARSRPAVLPHPRPHSVHPTITDSAPATPNPETLDVAWNELRELNLEWLFPDLELPRQQGSEWLSRVRQVGGSLRPLTNSVTSTFSILRRTWPGTHGTESNGADQAHLPSESDQFLS